MGQTQSNNHGGNHAIKNEETALFADDPLLVADYEKRKQVCMGSADDKQLYYTVAEYRNDNRVTVKVVCIRDDMLCGGTKSRITKAYFDTIGAQYTTFVYSTTAFGGAQIAIALECRARGKKFIVFTDNYGAYTKIAANIGAVIMMSADPHNAAIKYAKDNNSNTFLLPNGLRTPANVDLIKQHANRMRNTLRGFIRDKNSDKFDECICAVGSGALITGLYEAAIAKEYYGVCVFGKAYNSPPVNYIIPDMPFEQPYKQGQEPPFVSASRYDAKIWEYAMQHVNAATKPKVILAWFVM